MGVGARKHRRRCDRHQLIREGHNVAAVDLRGENQVVYESWHGNGNPPGGAMDMHHGGMMDVAQ